MIALVWLPIGRHPLLILGCDREKKNKTKTAKVSLCIVSGDTDNFL